MNEVIHWSLVAHTNGGLFQFQNTAATFVPIGGPETCTLRLLDGGNVRRDIWFP
jgi:hypothetical protein